MNEITVFTDGSFMKNKKTNEIKSGYGIYFPHEELPNVSRPFTHTPLTNQRAELYAIYKAIYYITKKLDVNKIIIYTDSEYSIKSLTVWIKQWKKNNWMTKNNKQVKNLDIINKIDNLINNFQGEVKFIHVRSHTGKKDNLSIWNDQVDKLAKEGANKNY